MDVASWVTRYIAANPVIMDTVPNTKPVGHNWGKAAEADSWTGEGASGEDVVVDGSVRWVRVQTVQRLALWVGQVSQGKQVTVKTLAWWEK